MFGMISKKRFFILLSLFALVNIATVLGLEVILGSPSGATYTTTRDVTFYCNATNSVAIASVSLYTDTDGTWSAKAVNTTSGTSVAVSFYITNISNGSYTWNCAATNGINTTFATSNNSFIMAYSNPAPVFSGQIANQSFNEDSSLSSVFDLDDYFSDNNQLSYMVYGNSSVIVSIDLNNVVSFSSAVDYFGNETIVFAAFDGESLTYSNNISIIVVPINDAPYLVSAIPNQSFSINTTLDLNSYFSDIDSNLSYATIGNLVNISVSIANGTALINGAPGFSGIAYVMFVASDGQYNVTSNNITLSISGVESLEFLSYSPSSDVKIKKGEKQEFNIVTSGANLVKWFLNGDAVKENSNVYTFEGIEAGVYVVDVVIAKDDFTTNLSRSWTVTVTEEDLTESSEASTGTISDVASILGSQGELVNCGDGKIDEGENCLNCPSDAKCAANEICVGGACVAKKSKVRYLVIFSVAAVVLIALGILLYYYTTGIKRNKIIGYRGYSNYGQQQEDKHNNYEPRY